MGARLWPRVYQYEQVQFRAYEIYLLRQRLGIPGTALGDWQQAIEDLS
jgi:hypothetical protein